MHAAFAGTDAVGKRVETIAIETGVPLESDLDFLFIFDRLEVADRVKQRVFRRIDMFDKVADTTVVLKHDVLDIVGVQVIRRCWLGRGRSHRCLVDHRSDVSLGIDVGTGLWFALGSISEIAKTNLKSAVKKRHHLQTVEQCLRPERELFEDCAVWPKPDSGAGLFGRRVTGNSQSFIGLTAIDKRHGVPFTFTVDVDLDPRRECVYNRDTHTMQAARNLVAAAAKFASGVEHGQHNFGSRQVIELGMFPNRDSPTVVDDFTTSIGKQ